MAGIEQALKAKIDEVIRFQPNATMTVVDPQSDFPDLRLSSFTAWVAPEPNLKSLYWLSSPARRHSQYIDSWPLVRGKSAPISGGMHVPQRPSLYVEGVFVNGRASRLTERNDMVRALNIFVEHVVFTPKEAEQYLNPPADSGNIPHQLYAADLTEATLFLGNHPIHTSRTNRIALPIPSTNL